MRRLMMLAGLLASAGFAYAVLPDVRRYLRLRAM